MCRTLLTLQPSSFLAAPSITGGATAPAPVAAAPLVPALPVPAPLLPALVLPPLLLPPLPAPLEPAAIMPPIAPMPPAAPPAPLPAQGVPIVTGFPQHRPGEKLGSLLHNSPGQSLSHLHTIGRQAPACARWVMNESPHASTSPRSLAVVMDRIMPTVLAERKGHALVRSSGTMITRPNCWRLSMKA